MALTEADLARRWELYHVAEDFSESHDLAAQHPEKLAELVGVGGPSGPGTTCSPSTPACRRGWPNGSR